MNEMNKILYYYLGRPGFLWTKIKKFWTLRIKDQDQKITFAKWSKIVNSPDQEIKDHCGSVLRDGSKIKDQQITFWKDHGSTKDQSSQIKQIKSSSNSFYQLPGKCCILCLICWLLKKTSNGTVKQTFCGYKKQRILWKVLRKHNDIVSLW